MVGESGVAEPVLKSSISLVVIVGVFALLAVSRYGGKVRRIVPFLRVFPR